MRKNWWKFLTIALLFYTIIAGLLMEVPRLVILNETIRALYFHVPMWFGMIIMLGVSVVYSIKYLRNPEQKHDDTAVEFANVGIIFGVLGILTGMLWAQFTWGDWWSGDPKQNAAAIGLLIYFAYFILRGSLDNVDQRARISAIYNIFAFSALIPLLFILPRLTDSLHPGSGGNPGFNAYDLDRRLRMVFYPAVLGWTLLGVWMASLRVRIKKIEHQLDL
ncbi:Cytochrome c-type biogenesis protein CcmC, putative heme lyase for CcmE [Fulvivirga imtechensis AK7]|uniref:Heme exporter protein C n=1 Tax=Fulvivirga imtechensis AK7 TaxID=1237149 RepID=L8JW40_9BACT|nr:cytochrome c biogenesis protein CcsA [Fulvivirga imtechensis]ELR71452.1 Cytochrome c-type biogenesis protein CcmC, putative heme lyase for CcmE [Fulvivirga imtechensis AK7]